MLAELTEVSREFFNESQAKLAWDEKYGTEGDVRLDNPRHWKLRLRKDMGTFDVGIGRGRLPDGCDFEIPIAGNVDIERAIQQAALGASENGGTFQRSEAKGFSITVPGFEYEAEDISADCPWWERGIHTLTSKYLTIRLVVKTKNGV